MIGEYTTAVGASSVQTCIKCQSGTFASQFFATVCTTCSHGQFTGVPGSAQCLLCSPGLYTDASTSKTVCSPCPSGSYSSTQGAGSCPLCSPGQYQDQPQQTSCKPCEIGTFQDTPGQFTCQRCQTCSNGWYTTQVCPNASTQDTSICRPCTICQDGSYATQECFKGSRTQLGYNVTCAVCTPCDNPNDYISDGCVSNYPKICSPCSVCDSVTIAVCSMYTDTECQYSAHCKQNNTFHIPDWIQNDLTYRCPKGQYISNVTSLGVECTPCPDYLAGLNGIYCEPCKGYTQPYWDSSACICITPLIQNDLGQCVCDKGYEFGYDSCSPCKNNTYNNDSIIVGNSWWTQWKECIVCPNGFYAYQGASECTPCPLYTYKVYDVKDENSLCDSCSQGFYAINPTSSLCTACNDSCGVSGQYSIPCPTDATKYICQDCIEKPSHAYWLEKSNITTTYECIWKCLPGFFTLTEPCQPCSNYTCPPGKLLQPCSLTSDMNCNLDCVNETKPLFNSEWGEKGCDWKCITGYVIQALDYGMWQQYECVMIDSLQFWTW